MLLTRVSRPRKYKIECVSASVYATSVHADGFDLRTSITRVRSPGGYSCIHMQICIQLCVHTQLLNLVQYYWVAFLSQGRYVTVPSSYTF